MTEEQLQKGIDLYQSISSIKLAIKNVTDMKPTDMVRVNLHYNMFISEDPSMDIDKIVASYAESIRSDIIESLTNHLVKLQHELDLI